MCNGAQSVGAMVINQCFCSGIQLVRVMVLNQLV